MAHDRIDPSDQIPEADLLEQDLPLDPLDLISAESTVVGAWPGVEADDADRAEQRAAVPGEDDDYPHDAPAGSRRPGQ